MMSNCKSPRVAKKRQPSAFHKVSGCWRLLIGILVLNLMSVELVAAPLSGSNRPKREAYLETFDHGPGGWYADRRYALRVWDGVAYCYSPWWVDANHAPPGAGYLHLVLWMHTDKRNYEG